MQFSAWAFCELPEEYMNQEAVERTCHGCLVKEIGQFIVNLNKDSADQVIDKIKDSQYNRLRVHDKPKKGVRQAYVSSDKATSSEDKTSDKLDIRGLFQFPCTLIKATSNIPYSINQLKSGILHSFLNVLIATMVNATFCICYQKMETPYMQQLDGH
jgi:hypothetical protein